MLLASVLFYPVRNKLLETYCSWSFGVLSIILIISYLLNYLFCQLYNAAFWGFLLSQKKSSFYVAN